MGAKTNRFVPEQRRKEHADVPDVGWDIEDGQDVVDAARGDHQTRVHGAANDPT